VKIVNETPFAFAALRTQPLPPAHALTVILKATFALKGDKWEVAEKQRELEPDKPYMDEIGRSLAWASDLAPIKPCADFYVLGTFYQPGGVAAPEGRGAIQFGALRKELLFLGPGHAAQAADGAWIRSARAPMVSVPLRWEFSYGGLSDPRNPMGRGVDRIPLENGREQKGQSQQIEPVVVQLPQIEPINGNGEPRPVNFAPLPPGFALRRGRLGTRDRHWAVFRAPLPPKDYDPRYHNAAPDDQQIADFARGDEDVVLTNLHPRMPQVATTLPGLRPRVGLLRRGLGGVLPEELRMRLDTVVALPDEDQFVLIWRGVVPLSKQTEEGEIEWLQARMENLADSQPFDSLALAMFQAWQASQEKPPPPPKEALPLPEPDVAAALGKARDLLAKAKLPPAVQQVVDTESDPMVIFNTLTDHMQKMLAALQAK
jgi:hypothetical protein